MMKQAAQAFLALLEPRRLQFSGVGIVLIIWLDSTSFVSGLKHLTNADCFTKVAVKILIFCSCQLFARCTYIRESYPKALCNAQRRFRLNSEQEPSLKVKRTTMKKDQGKI